MIPTEEQIKELWEWCGLKMSLGGYWGVATKDGRIDHYIPNFRVDLNNLFKYAVPKLKIEWHNWESVLHDWVDELTGDYEKDAMSLFGAIFKVIK